ncbi:MAG: ATP-dependent protease [Candidatus Melainabacteria bacterium]|nr:MAG: ATP-dependent protease [Candidatus Melainabacteria bacterium]
MSSPSSVTLRQLPLFPLPEVVLFPKANLPLHIFEMRYREMVQTILASDCCFGVLMWDPATKETARIGCVTEIDHVERLQDGRMNILTRGLKRFRVVELLKKKPYLVGLVEWLYDDQPDRDLSGLCEDAVCLLTDVARLSGRLTERIIELPGDLPRQPEELSYWVAANLYGDASEQQALLELQDTAVRLEREIETLATTVKELAARTAIKEAFA